MPYELDLLQINAGKRRTAAYDIQLRTRDLKNFILLVQEPWMVGGKPACLDTQHPMIYANCDPQKPARALIYSHKDAKVSPCPEFTGRDTASALWEIGMPNLPQIMLISVYWDSKYSALPQKFLDCVRECKQKNIPLHVGGDFNAHQTLWGGEKGFPQGECYTVAHAGTQLGASK